MWQLKGERPLGLTRVIAEVPQDGSSHRSSQLPSLAEVGESRVVLLASMGGRERLGSFSQDTCSHTECLEGRGRGREGGKVKEDTTMHSQCNSMLAKGMVAS